MEVFQEEGQFVARCLELDVASFGQDEKGALEAAADAIELYLSTLAEEGQLEHVLKERGVDVRPGRHAPDEEEVVEVTLQLRPGSGEYVAARTFPIPAIA